MVAETGRGSPRDFQSFLCVQLKSGFPTCGIDNWHVIK